MGSVIKLEKALSARSTCRITGETIEKGELRVGVDTWLGGRVATMWLKLLPFLEACHLEHCPNNRATCKKTGEKFKKGDVRVVVGNSDHKVNLSLQAAAEELQPLLEAAGDGFSLSSFKGLGELTKEEIIAFCEAFGVDEKDLKVTPVAKEVKADAEGEKKPARKGKAGPKQAKKKKKGSESEDEEDEGEGEEAGEESEEEDRPAKRRKQNAVQQQPRRTSARHAKKHADADKQEAEDKQAVKAEEVKEEVTAEDSTPVQAGGVKQETASPPPDDDDPMEEGPVDDRLTDYERQRQLQIERNRERLMALSIPSLAKEVLPTPAPNKPAATRGITNKKVKAPREPIVLRQSSRIRGMTADAAYVGGIISENRDGSVVLASGKLEVSPGTTARHVDGPLPFASENGNPKSDAAFLELLRGQAVTGDDGGQDKTSSGTKAQPYEKMKLAEKDVAKITKDGIAVIAFHPSNSTLLVAAGDKQGKLGLWHVDHQSNGDGEDEYDGVLMYTPHQQYISGLKWLSQGGTVDKLLTASYDGCVRVMDLQAEQFLKVSGTPDNAEFSCSEAIDDTQLVLLGDPDGDFYVLDMRSNKMVHKGLNLHGRKINSLHLEPSTQRLLASAGTDATVNVWDIRHVISGDAKSVKPLSSGTHMKSCQAAYWCPDGSCRLLSTSFDDTLVVWHDPTWSLAKQGAALGKGPAQFKMAKQHVMKHDNNTGRWLSPFKAIWGVEGDAILVGDMKRAVAVFGSDGKEKPKLQSEHMTAIPTRMCVHPTRQVLAACTSSGRVHIYK